MKPNHGIEKLLQSFSSFLTQAEEVTGKFKAKGMNEKEERKSKGGIKDVTKQTKQHIMGADGRREAECKFDKRKWPACRYGNELPESGCIMHPKEENPIGHSKMYYNQIFRR